MAADEAAKIAASVAACEKLTPKRSINSDNDATKALWEKKITQAEQQCQKSKKINRMLFNRLYQMKKITKKTQWQNRCIAMELDKHDDQYRDVSIFFPSAILGEGSMVVKANPERIRTALKKNEQKTVSHKPERTVPEKDPNAPKKPANAFFMYCQQKRNDILAENPALNHHDLTKLLAKGWNQSNTDEKQEYYSMYEHDKERYEKQLKEYTEKGQFTHIEKCSKETISTAIVSNVPRDMNSINGKAVTQLDHSTPISTPIIETMSNQEVVDPVCFDLPSSDPNLPSSALSTDDHEDNEDSFCMDID